MTGAISGQDPSAVSGFTYTGFHDVMGEDRTRIAPRAFWMSADEVVDASLRALPAGTLIVVPGWQRLHR